MIRTPQPSHAAASRTAPAPRWVIHLQAAAPAKPPARAPCNGCGLCCAAAPCPLGMLLSRRRRGPCSALTWSDAHGRYLCGAIAEPAAWLPWLPTRWARSLASRWVAADTACDAELEADLTADLTADHGAGRDAA